MRPPPGGQPISDHVELESRDRDVVREDFGQVRDIARVTTAVANGDLGQKIMVELKG